MSRRIDCSQSYLAVIDIQERLFRVFSPESQERIEKNTLILLGAAETLGVPVGCTEQYPEGLGTTVNPVARALGGALPRWSKTTFSAFGCGEFRSHLESTGRNTVVLAGIEAHICVFQTAQELLDSGFRVVVAADAVGSRADANWKWGLEALAQQGALVLPTETVAFAWLQRAGTPEFKAISKLVK